MKKIISVMLVLLMLLIPVGASAETQEADPTLIMMGDINKDSKISAMDARLILRYSAKLDTEELSLYSADADGNGKINAADARTVLRVAAGLSQFTCGFNGKGVPCVVNTLLSDKYSVDASYDETGTGKGVKTDITLTVDGGSIYFISYTSEFDTENDSTAMFGKIKAVGMLLIGEDMYAIMVGNDASFAIPITDALIDAMGGSGELFGDDFALDAETLRQTSGFISSFLTADLEAPEKAAFNNEACYRYIYTIGNQQFALYVDLMGKIKTINIVTSSGRELSLIEFSKVSGDKPSLDIKDYEVIELF